MKLTRIVLGALALALLPGLALADTAFRPVPDATVSLSVTTTTARVAFGALPSGGGTLQFRLHNAGSSTVFVKHGDCASVTATTAAMPLPAGAVEVLSYDVNDARGCIAGITATGTTTLYVTTGQGL